VLSLFQEALRYLLTNLMLLYNSEEKAKIVKAGRRFGQRGCTAVMEKLKKLEKGARHLP